MNNLVNLILPAVFGLVAGVGHGIVSHHAELPVSLSEQFLQPLHPDQFPKD